MKKNPHPLMFELSTH